MSLYFISEKNQNNLLWIAISIVSLLLAYYSSTFILNDTLYYNSLGEKISIERIERLLSNQKQYRWMGYILIPFFILIKVLLITSCLYTRLFLAETTKSVKKIIQSHVNEYLK